MLTATNLRLPRWAAAARRWASGHGIPSLGILWLELVFKAATTGGFWPSLPVVTLFSLSVGQALALLCSLPPSRRMRQAATAALLGLMGILFCVEYFVYRQFKLFYDPTTVISGAGGVATQFGDEAAALILTPSGVACILLFLLPALACTWLAVHGDHDGTPEPDRGSRLIETVGCVLPHLLALLLIGALGQGELYTSRFNFQAGVQGFGLVTSMRKDLQSKLSGQAPSFEEVPVSKAAPADDVAADDDAADDDAADDDATVGEGDAEATDAKAKGSKRRRYRPATLDIDFDALAESTDNETWANLDRYVGSLTPSRQNRRTGYFKGFNLVFISAEAFSAEAIREDVTPTLWRMWNEGIQLTDYYQFDTAGTTGGECANLFGLLATEGGSSVKMTADHNNYLTLGNLLNREGYEGWAFHNNTYTYYGRDVTHNNLGYNHGYMGYGNGMEEWVDWQWPQSDLQMVAGTFDQLYGDVEPFNVYYMSVSGHSNYDPWDNIMAQKNWDVVADLPYSDRVKGYLAANVELDRAMAYLLEKLEERGIADRTVIVISADHFPYGLDDDAPLGSLPYLSELYGYEVTNVFQRDHNRPIIWSGKTAKRKKPIVVDEPTMSIDLLPTLCNLFGLPWDSRLLPGRDVLAKNTEGIAFNLSYDWRTELGTYWAGSGRFEPVEGAEVPEGYVEEHNALVANKIAYCHGVLTSDYYRHVFGDPEDVQSVHDAAADARRKSD